MSSSPPPFQWKPARDLSEVDKIMCAPGMPHEMETLVIGGRVQRVYRNLWPSLRDFWLTHVAKYSDRTYIVFGDERFTFEQVHEQAVKAAALFRNVYAIKKGDRVGICSKNCPEYIIVFWACHLLGAVTVLANAWLPSQTLSDCLVHTQCKLLFFDIDWADQLKMEMGILCQRAGATGFLVFDFCSAGNEKKGQYPFFKSVLRDSKIESTAILREHLVLLPEDNATILFTSGRVASLNNRFTRAHQADRDNGETKRLSLHSTPVAHVLAECIHSHSGARMVIDEFVQVTSASTRAALRRGGDVPIAPSGPQRSVLVPVPLFHVSGSTTLLMMATMNGSRVILMPKWDAEHAARLIQAENVALAGGVPAMISDLLRSSLVSSGYKLDGLLFGGSPAPESLAKKARESFPSASPSQVYGLTEVNSTAASISGEDYVARPGSTGRACPVNDIIIVKKNKILGPGELGEIWLRGPNVMQGYWNDPDATAKVLTPDGWLRTGDLGILDEEGFLYIKDRIKDVIIRGGENIASVAVENALYSDSRVLEAAAVAVHDERLGELPAAVVYIAPEFRGQVTEDSLSALAKTKLPKFAVPVLIVFAASPFDLTASGKVIKTGLRELARRVWEERKAEKSKSKL